METNSRSFERHTCTDPDSLSQFNHDKLKDIFSTNLSGIAVHPHV